MSTMTRTDIHRPSAVEFNPEDYVVRGFADFHEIDGYRPVQVVSALVDEGYSFRGAPHGSGQCSHCGARLRYAALMSHEPTKTLLYVGETCLDNRFSSTAAEFAEMRRVAAAKAEKSRREGKSSKFYAENPDLVYMTYAYNIGEAGGTPVYSTACSYGEEFDTYAEAEAALDTRPGMNDAVLTGSKWGTTWSEQTRMGDKIQTLADMAWKVERYGEISEKAVDYARKILTWISEAEEKRVVREAASAAARAAAKDVPTGRIVIEGEIVSTKWVDTGFGSQQKMLVLSADGWKVWGSVPSSLDVDKGDRVRFTATVEQSRDDALFGFFKRPTKAEKI